MKNKLNNMLMKILVLVILFLQMNPLSAVCAYNGVPPKTGSWLMWRNDKANTGMQNLPGEIVTPEQLKSIFMKGAVAGQPFFSDINHDNQPEIFFIDSGKVVAMDIYGSIAWSSDFILANTIYCVDDMDNDRRKEILVFGDMQLIVLDAQTGSILIKLDFQDQVARPRFLLNDFDKDGCKEAVIWIYGDDYLHIYKFHRKDNFFHADEINTIDATEYQIGAFYPGLAFADTNNDSFDELILIRHGGVSIYNAKAFSSEEEKGLDPISRVDYIPEGADNGRFYGYFTMQDVTGDDIPDGVIVADGVSMHVGMMEGGVNNIKKSWDHYYGYSGKTDASGKSVIMKVVNNAVVDVMRNGQPYLVYGIFEYSDGSAVGDWKLNVIRATDYNDPENISLKGYYLWAVEDIGEGNSLFFLSEESSANPVEPGAYEIFTFNDKGQFIKLNDLPYSLPKKSYDFFGYISPASYSAETKLYTLDADHDGYLELLAMNSTGYHILKITKDGGVKAVTSVNKFKGSIYADFFDKDGSLHFIANNQKGLMRCINDQGEVLWQYQCGGPVTPDILIGDVNGKGKNSLIVAYDGMVYIYNADINGEWKPQTAFSGVKPILADMNNDHIYEIVIKASRGDHPGFRVMNAAGIEIWSSYIDKDLEGVSLGFNNIRDFTIGDITGDGVPDIVAGLQNTYPLGRTAIIDGQSKTVIYITAPITKINYVHSGAGIVDRATLAQPGSFALYDVDGDGRDEVYFVSLEAFMRLKAKQNEYALDTYVAQISGDLCKIYYSTPYLFDMNQDGTPDYFFGAGFNSISMFSGKMGLSFLTSKQIPLWNLTVDNGYDLMYRHQGLVYNQGDKSGMVGIQFTSGDEDEKGCFATYDGKTGSFIWKINLKERYGGTNVSTENIISCDIDNDKKMEFIFGTNTGYLVALKGDRYEIAENERVLWDVSIGASVSTIAIGDVYNTGKSAVVFAANDGYIHIVTDTGGTQTQEQTPDLHNKKSDSLFILVGILLGTLIISYTLVIVIKQKKV